MENEYGEETPQVPEEKTEENQDLLKKFQTVEAQKEHWREKAVKFETELTEAKKQIPAKAEIKEEPKAPLQQDPRDIVRLAKALSGYSDEEVNFIYKNAKDVNLDSIIEATKDPWVKSAIDSTREKVAKENKIPESSLVPGGKANKVITDEVMKNDPDAHKKAFEEFMKTGQNQEQGI